MKIGARKLDEVPAFRTARGIGVGKYATVYPATFGSGLDKMAMKFPTERKALPCICESINEQGIACLAFDIPGGVLRECFRVDDSAVQVTWRDTK